MPPENVDARQNPMFARLLLLACRNRRRIPFLHRFVGAFLGCDIYCDIPEGLYLPHPYGIVIHSRTKLGRNVTVLQHVTIGVSLGEQQAATIGDDAYFGAGAAVIGAPQIGSRVVVGANSVVTKDIPDGAVVVGANRIVRFEKSSEGTVASEARTEVSTTPSGRWE